jgi:ATP-dependent RNA helicase DeaD
VKSKNVTADNVTQYFTRASEGEKFDFLTRMIDVQSPEAAIIFGRTKRRVDEVARALKVRGYDAEGIHGDLDQRKRMQILNDFKNNRIEFLVATDVAARGLDISHVTHIYNYDIPQDPESYVHRIGRTGRAGKKGTAITFVSNNEMGYLKLIEKETKQQMAPLSPPSSQEVLEGQLNTVVENLTQNIEDGSLEDYYEKGSQLLNSFSADDIAAAYIKATIQDTTEIPVSITPERPLPKKGFQKNNKGRNRKGKGKGGRRRNNRRRGKGKNKGRGRR